MFCCSAHRQGYRARLGKVLDSISAHQPPPAPIAAFIPCKPFPGNNHGPLWIGTPEPSHHEFQFLRTWSLPVVPLSRERAAPLCLLQPLPPAAADFRTQTNAEPWVDGPAIRQLRMELTAENPLPAFARAAGEDPAPAGPVPVDLPAEAVEAVLSPTLQPRMFAYAPPAAALPRWAMDAAQLVIVGALADPAAGPAAEAVESLLPSAPKPQIAVWPASAAVSPRLPLHVIAAIVGTAITDPADAPPAEAVESLLPPAVEPQIAAWPVTAAALPRLPLDPTDWVIAAATADPAAVPVAEAVESLLPSAPEPQIAAWPVTAAALPRLPLDPTDWVIAAATADPAAVPVAKAVESLLPSAAEPSALAPSIAALRLPDLTLIAAQPDPLEEFVPPLVVAPPSETRMPGPPACEAVREVIPAFAGALPALAAAPNPAALTFALEPPLLRWAGGWRTSAPAEPVCSYIAPRLETALPASFAVCLPDMRVLQGTPDRHAAFLAAPADERHPDATEPAAADSLAIAASSQEQSPLMLHFPGLGMEQTTGNRAAPFQPGHPSAAEPLATAPNPWSALPRDPTVQTPAAPEAVLRCGFPLAKPAAMDFICQRTPMAPFQSLDPVVRAIPAQAPKFVVRPLFERIEEAAAPPDPASKTPAFAEIFAVRKASLRHSSPSSLFSAGKAIAASLLVGVGIWFGAGSVRIGTQMLAINTSIRDMGSGGSSGIDSGSRSPVPSLPSAHVSPPRSPEGLVATVRRAIQGRAAVELTDTFRRMEVWGAGAVSLPAGWSRHPNGYVNTGQLALYRPAQTFADYRFEFFGEIEKKSMGWAIRARDTENYYAMKMTVIEPGLRPVIAAVHYSVIGGRKGPLVETPLSVMMHNHEPYHVEVDVKGDHVVTSIEGQEVDSWTDDALKVGGIGFFSDAGERARLYWMKVARNQDWLGRVCAYLSSGSGADSAELWPGQFPNGPSQPSQPALPPSADVTLAAGEDTEEFLHGGPQRARTLKYGRTELCRS